MAPPADHPDHWQRNQYSTSVQPLHTQGRRAISTEADRYNTRSRNRARSNEGSGGNAYITQGSSPPPEEAQTQPSQTDYVMAPSSHPPQTAVTGQNLFQEPFEIQVRGRLGVTAQIREDLALGRLFGVLTIIPTDGVHHSGINGGGRSHLPAEQVVAAVSPVPSLDDASDSSPPPPFVAGTLTFASLQVHQAGRWRISISLLRVNNSVPPLESQEGVISLGTYETDEILVY
jgi:hypothetical protein